MSSSLAGMRGSTGEADGAALYQRDLQRRAEFSAPQEKFEIQGDTPQLSADRLQTSYASRGMHLDPYGGPPVKYTTDSEMKDYMVTKQNVRDAINAAAPPAGQPSNVVRTDPITEQEVAYRKQMDDVGELARFEAYVRAGWGGRDKMDMILKEYPQLIAREVDQINTDAKYALRCKLIDLYGCRDFDDIHFQYARDQGLITGPRLSQSVPIDSQYQGGVMSPYSYARKRSKENEPFNGLRLPYSTVTDGPKIDPALRATAAGGDGMAFPTPLGDTQGTGKSMYKPFEASAGFVPGSRRNSASAYR